MTKNYSMHEKEELFMNREKTDWELSEVVAALAHQTNKIDLHKDAVIAIEEKMIQLGRSNDELVEMINTNELGIIQKQEAAHQLARDVEHGATSTMQFIKDEKDGFERYAQQLENAIKRDIFGSRSREEKLDNLWKNLLEIKAEIRELKNKDIVGDAGQRSIDHGDAAGSAEDVIARMDEALTAAAAVLVDVGKEVNDDPTGIQVVEPTYGNFEFQGPHGPFSHQERPGVICTVFGL